MKTNRFTLLVLGLFVFAQGCAAKPDAAKNDWPKGIDPATLTLNTTAEPDLADDGFKSLFNGTDLTGWTVKGGQMEFKVEDGVIIGTCNPEIRMNSFLCTDKNYTDFIFTVEFKWEVEGNSGIMFRADTRETGRVFGYQSEMDPSDRAWTGGIYGEAMDGWIYPLSKEEHAEARAAVERKGEWNRMTVLAKGNFIQTWINGVPCAEAIDDSRQEGFFGLQVHQGKEGTIHWKNIKVKKL